MIILLPKWREAAKMTWVAEEIDKNRYKTVFPTKGEMHRMIE
jgi:citrate lyase beta subunit